jgi:hypothetical protein
MLGRIGDVLLEGYIYKSLFSKYTRALTFEKFWAAPLQGRIGDVLLEGADPLQLGRQLFLKSPILGLLFLKSPILGLFYLYTRSLLLVY